MYNEIFSKLITPELNNFVVERQKNRCNFSNVTKIMDVLSLPSGPVILDVGAGTGYFSYAFAEHLKDKGQIYAVEVFQDRYEYIKEQIKIKNYKSIFPVLLSLNNDDKFYWQNNYDLIFFGNSFEYVNNKKEFLLELRKRLNENGKLAIIIHRDILPFFSSDVIDQAGLIEAALNEPHGSLFNLSANEDPLSTLNIFLNSIEWAGDYLRYCFESNWLPLNELNAPDRSVLLGIISFLKREENIFDDNFYIRDKKMLTPKIMLMCRIINKLIISNHYGRYLRRDIFSENYLPNAPGMQSSIFLREIKEVLGAAGYSFSGVYDFIPWYYLVIFNK